MAFSLPSSWQPRGSSAAGPAGEGEVSSDDVYGILANLSGLAGDVGDTINSLKTTTGKNGTPVNKPSIAPPNPDNNRNYLLIGAPVHNALTDSRVSKNFR